MKVGRTLYHVMVMLGCVGGCVAMAFTYMTWKATENRTEPAAPNGAVHSLDVISLQVDILGLTMAAVGIGLGIVGLFGYQSIRAAAEDRADKVADRVAREVTTALVPQLIPDGGVPDSGHRNSATEASLGVDVTVEKEG